MDAVGSVAPDVIMLQEIGRKPTVVQRFNDGLAGIGLDNFFCSADLTSERKKYGCIIASKWPLTPHEPGWAPGVPWHQLLARATVQVDGTDIDVITAHIPNGSGNGWKKVETFEALATYLANAPDQPRILGGDFNEPREVRPTGQMVTWGQKVCTDGTLATSGTKKGKCGETHPRYRWDHGVRSVLAGASSHGLRHAFLDRHGWRTEPTHVIRGKPRFFDHLLVSHHFDIDDAGYRHDWREPSNGMKKLSDHSAAWAALQLQSAPSQSFR